ncbi:hypothetical protein [Flavimarina sp. Hel_I_48]|uniref:hypothetical protein n=1 Tax=Flavimarina sp. Hel_I_48 TaxID=1392488 RepID=UPI0004DFA525|nr:hypothetical protein [Flavimarina sp. Hel_I_48]
MAHVIPAELVGLSFKHIEKELNINSYQRELMLSELDKSEEIIFYHLEERGCYIDQKNGFAALSNRKYINQHWSIILDWIKNFVQIVIPVLALIVAYISFTSKMNSIKMQYDKELQDVKNIILEQKDRLEELEKQNQIFSNPKKIDSL